MKRILVTTTKGANVVFNMAHIVCYYELETGGTNINTMDRDHTAVTQTMEEIDAMIDFPITNEPQEPTP